MRGSNAEKTVTGMTPGVSLHVESSVAYLTLDRGDSANALTLADLQECARLAAAIDTLSVVVVVLRSAGPSIFCAGADVNEYADHIGDPEWGLLSEASVVAAAQALHRIRVPTIAIVGGACIGAGVALAVACDVRLGTRACRFAIPSLKLGLAYPYGTTGMLIEAIGSDRARYMLLTGAWQYAEDALRIGLLHELCDSAEELDQRLDALVTGLREVPIDAIGTTKNYLAGQRSGVETLKFREMYRKLLGGDRYRASLGAWRQRHQEKRD